MGNKKVPTSGGSAHGHSNMEHGLHTEEIKDSARKARRAEDYRVVSEWSDEDDVFVARVPALPGCAAHGDTVEDAEREVRIAAQGILDVMAEHGDAVPTPDGG